MVAESQAAHVMALVQERHAAVKTAFEELLNSYATGDQSRIVSANESLRAALNQLRAVVATQHLPPWFKDLAQQADQYASRHNVGMPVWSAHLDSALRNAQALNQESWSFSDEPEVLFNIDEIVRKAREEHKIDALYGRVIECLDALLRSGEIDSIKAATDLQRLIATLSEAKVGSFSSQILSWQFARRLLPNIIAAYVKRNSVTGPLIEAFEKTASELDVGLGAAKDQIGERILMAAADALRTDASAGITHEGILFLESPASPSAAEVDAQPSEA
jgi:hypothetical protein